MKIYNSTYKDFLDYIRDRDVVCYGAGKMLDEMSASLTDLPIVSRSLHIVDGDENKIGSIRRLFDRGIYIQKPDLTIQNMHSPIVLITSAAIVDIIDILEGYNKDDLEVFSFLMMRKAKYDKELISIEDREEILGSFETMQIPKRIHYFWFGCHDIPDEYKKNIETWNKYCPSYEIIRWDESNCNINENRYAREAYDKGKYGFVPDYFRLKKVYEYGGIYLDTDVELLKPLDDLLYLTAYAGFEDNEKVALGVGFGAIKGFPLLKEMYQVYEDISFIKDDGSLNTIASPVYQTAILKKHGLICDGGMQIVDNMTILPMNYLTVQSNHTGKRYITSKSFSIHKYAASWFDEKDRANKHKAEELLQAIESV